MQNKSKTDSFEQKISNSIKNMYMEKAKKLDVNIAKLDALSPLKVMHRGYSVTQNKKGILKSISDTFCGDEITVKLADGTLECAVNNINKEN